MLTPLPQELILKIMSKCDSISLAKFESTCTLLYKTSDNGWENVVKSALGASTASILKIDRSNWKAVMIDFEKTFST